MRYYLFFHLYLKYENVPAVLLNIVVSWGALVLGSMVTRSVDVSLKMPGIIDLTNWLPCDRQVLWLFNPTRLVLCSIYVRTLITTSSFLILKFEKYLFYLSCHFRRSIWWTPCPVTAQILCIEILKQKSEHVNSRSIFKQKILNLPHS